MHNLVSKFPVAFLRKYHFVANYQKIIIFYQIPVKLCSKIKKVCHLLQIQQLLQPGISLSLKPNSWPDYCWDAVSWVWSVMFVYTYGDSVSVWLYCTVVQPTRQKPVLAAVWSLAPELLRLTTTTFKVSDLFKETSWFFSLGIWFGS